MRHSEPKKQGFNAISKESTAPLHAPDLGMLRVFSLVRIGLAYSLLHLSTFGHVLFAPLWYPHSYWAPVSTAFIFGGPPEVWQVQWICILGILFTLLLGLGAWTRYTGPLAFVFAGMMSIISFSYGRLNHNTNTVLLLLLVFSFSDWGKCFSLDAAWNQLRRKWTAQKSVPFTEHYFKTTYPEWPMLITIAQFSLLYFTTAVFKILKGNFMEPGYIAALIKHKQLLWDVHSSVPEWTRHLQNFIMANAWIGNVLAYVTLGIELFFFVALFSKAARVFMLAAALILHSSITLTTKVYFLEHQLMLALLLSAALVLFLREKHGGLQALFPKTPVASTAQPYTEPENTRTPWLKSVIAYAVGFMGLVAIAAGLHLPEIPLKTWLSLSVLHEQWPLFPTNTFIFDYTRDLTVSAVFWGYSFIVLSVFCASFLWRILNEGMMARHLQLPRERILIYDQDCGFCQNWCDWSIARGGDQSMRFLPGQKSVELLRSVGLGADEYLKYSIYIEWDERGQAVCIEKGAGAINKVLGHLPGFRNLPLRVLGLFYWVDGIRQIQDLGYVWVANNRHRLAPGACKVNV